MSQSYRRRITLKPTHEVAADARAGAFLSKEEKAESAALAALREGYHLLAEVASYMKGFGVPDVTDALATNALNALVRKAKAARVETKSPSGTIEWRYYTNRNRRQS